MVVWGVNDGVHDVASKITLAKYYWENSDNEDDDKETKDKNRLIALRWILKAAYDESEALADQLKFDTDFESEFAPKQQVNDDEEEGGWWL